MNITDESKDVAVKKGLTPRVAFQESPGEVDMDEAIHTKNAFSYFESDHIQLLGPVMFYKKSPLGAFDTSMTYLYSKIHDQHAWVSSDQLYVLTSKFSNPINQANQKIIKQRVDTPILLNHSLNCEASHGDINNNEVFHKNHVANLSNICEKCHKEVHRLQKRMSIKKTSDGFEINESQ